MGEVKGNTDAVKDALNSTLSDGGPDGYYELQMTDEGTLGFGDLKQFGSPMGADWIGQVSHTTSGPKHYADTINFNIKKVSDDVSLVRAHSTSGVGGAFGDNGQNYKNIVMAMKAAFGGKFKNKAVDASCPAASVSVQAASFFLSFLFVLVNLFTKSSSAFFQASHRWV